MVTRRSIPSTDTLSFTVPDHAWINLQWLFDGALYLLYQLGGAAALVVASAVAYTAAIWLLTKNLRLFVGAVPAAVLTLWAVLVAQERFLIRPEMASFVLFEAVLWVLLTARQSDGRRVWMLVPLMLVWVNCHSLFIIGLFCIACAAVAPLVGQLPFMPAGVRHGSQLSPSATRRLLIAAAAATVVTLVNPYGLTGVLFPFKLLSRIDGSSPAFQSIGEFRRPFTAYFPTFSITTYQVFFVASVIVVALGTLLGLGKPRSRPAQAAAGVDLGRLAMFCGLGYLSLLARRNIGVFVLGAAPLAAACAAALETKVTPSLRRWMQVAARVLAPALLAACAALVLAVGSNAYYRWDGTTSEFGLGVLEVNFPIRAAAFARQMRLPGKVYNDLTSGGYLTWDPPADGGVFIDGRLEVYDTAFFTRYSAALNNPRAWEQQADQLGVNTAILFHRWANRHAVIRWLAASRGWTLVYYDEVATVFVRTPGQEQLIAEAQRRFPEWQQQTLNRLAAAPARWQWPVGRAMALESYAAVLFTLGLPDQSVEFYQRLVDLGPPPEREAAARYQIAAHLVRQGDTRQARQQLQAAAARDPGNAEVRQLLARLGG